MHLHRLTPAKGSRSKKIRPGRGSAAGRGTTAGRGTKGQQSRQGKGTHVGFEGGQTPLLRRQPKLGGFLSVRKITYEVVNLGTLEAKLEAGTYGPAELKSARLVSGKSPVKLLGKGDLSKKFALTVHAASKSAKAAVAKAGGSVTLNKTA